ncbi:MAG TPA: hypothetical protein VEC39_18300 [Vicinamibacterales bacterium]|nr:hypothetical protein [Vicinamibacterales bacterium]
MLGWRTAWAHFIATAVVLAVVLWAVPDPSPTDEHNMQRIGQQVLIAGCDDLNCFRILVPAIVESFPGPVLERWRWYAVIGNAAGAVVTAELALAFGLSRHAALLTLWLSALGFGSMSTVYHPYTADSMMFLLCPLITLLLVRGHLWWAAALAAVGIFGKEVAAAPLFIAAIAHGLMRQWRDAGRTLTAALAVTAIWVSWQLALMSLFQYGYGPNPSVDIFGGGYLRYWLEHAGWRNAAVGMFVEFGAVWILAAYGVTLAPPTLRAFAIGAVPAALALAYVQIPDRALWNFYHLWLPLASLVLVSLRSFAGWCFAAMFGVANVRVAAQVMAVPPIRIPIAVTVVIAVVAIVATWRGQRQLTARSVHA